MKIYHVLYILFNHYGSLSTHDRIHCIKGLVGKRMTVKGKGILQSTFEIALGENRVSHLAHQPLS